MTHSRLANLLRLVSGGAEEAETTGWRELRKGGKVARKKSCLGNRTQAGEVMV